MRNGGREHLILSNKTIVAWAIGLAMVAVGLTLGLFKLLGDDMSGHSRIEAIRLTSTFAVGTGGAAALLLTARRQRFAEIDGTERRITELQTKAADQLGHERAAVRLAGMHSLERLAQDYPSQQQAIVNIICAYLRMPFTFTSSRPLKPLRPQVKTEYMLTRKLESENVQAGDREQEKQVRITAQRILCEHLSCRGKRFWDEISLDLSGATLINFAFRGVQVARADFSSCSFVGNLTDFRRARFEGKADFSGATFRTPSADFSGACFGFKARRHVGDIKLDDDVADFRLSVADAIDFSSAEFGACAWPEEEREHTKFYGARFRVADFAEAGFHTHFPNFHQVDFERAPNFDGAEIRYTSQDVASPDAISYLDQAGYFLRQKYEWRDDWKTLEKRKS